jgi:AraC family transcriptional regulator
LGGVTLTEYECLPGYRTPKHSHERAYVKLVLAGTYPETYENRTRLCQPSAVIFHPAGELHSEHFGSEGGRTFSVEFGPRVHRGIPDSLNPLLDRAAAFQGGPVAWLAFRLYDEFRNSDIFSALAVEGLTLELIAMAGRSEATPTQPPPVWLARAVEIVRTHFSGHLSLTYVAREVGVHPVHLARAFRCHMHCSVGEYIRRVRVDYVCRQLSKSPRSLAEIALDAGFADQSHLSRTFKRVTGLPPAAFRRSPKAR